MHIEHRAPSNTVNIYGTHKIENAKRKQTATYKTWFSGCYCSIDVGLWLMTALMPLKRMDFPQNAVNLKEIKVKLNAKRTMSTTKHKKQDVKHNTVELVTGMHSNNNMKPNTHFEYGLGSRL